MTPRPAPATPATPPAGTSALDADLEAVVAWFTARADMVERFSGAIRQSFDEVYDGQRTGRYSLAELSKVEKTYIGTKVEILIQDVFGLGRGRAMDYVIAETEVDCKWSMARGGWMIPREAVGHVLLCVTADDVTSRFSVGVVRAVEGVLTGAANQDGKRRLTPQAAAGSVRWLVDDGRLHENLLLHIDAATRARILAGRSGQARVDELFRCVQGRLIRREAVLTVAQQSDGPKRVRDTRHRLQPEGILVLGHQDSHPGIAATLGLPVPAKGEWVSARVVPTGSPGPGVAAVRGRLWRLATPEDEIQPGPIDYR